MFNINVLLWSVKVCQFLSILLSFKKPSTIPATSTTQYKRPRKSPQIIVCYSKQQTAIKMFKALVSHYNKTVTHFWLIYILLCSSYSPLFWPLWLPSWLPCLTPEPPLPPPLCQNQTPNTSTMDTTDMPPLLSTTVDVWLCSTRALF